MKDVAYFTVTLSGAQLSAVAEACEEIADRWSTDCEPDDPILAVLDGARVALDNAEEVR